MLKIKDKYYFIDFEYAGLDNPNKTILDLICQPNHYIDKELEDYIIRGLGNMVDNKGRSWRRDLSKMRRIIIIKWCFIMMNTYRRLTMKKRRK